MLSSLSELNAIFIEFSNGEQFGWSDGRYRERIAREFHAAELVEKLITGELVEKLPDDRVELRLIGIDRIAGTLSDPRKPVTANRVRYLQSAGLGELALGDATARTRRIECQDCQCFSPPLPIMLPV